MKPLCCITQIGGNSLEKKHVLIRRIQIFPLLLQSGFLQEGADLKKQWCWIFNNLATFVWRPEHLDSSFDDIIDDARTRYLSTVEKQEYMDALQLSERERRVIYEGGIIVGREEGREEGLAKGREEGRAEGRAEMRMENARAFLEAGVPVETIAKALALTEWEIEQITGSVF